MSALRQYKSTQAAVQVADLTAGLAREQVATFVALAHLTAQRGILDVRAARADFVLAEALLRLARQQRAVGVANGIDVVRAESRWRSSALRVVQAEASAVQDRLDLERRVALPQGSATVLTDSRWPPAGSHPDRGRGPTHRPGRPLGCPRGGASH
ncbi:MAG: hypothetical protein WKG07_17615 [Hymenobacter sp.]